MATDAPATAQSDATQPAAAHPDVDPTTRERILADVAALRASFDAGTTRPLQARLDQLDALARGVRAERSRLVAALAEDLGKSRTESAITELGVVTAEIAHMRRNLRGWLRPQSFDPGALLAPARGQIRREPLGTTLIIAPWNYPVNLALAPLIGVIAGGNTALLKPSEVAPATSAALAHLVRTHLDPAWVRVVEGGVPETTLLLEQRFDLILYTGNGTVGRIVSRAAAEHLTPVVLELGGKSPVFVDEGTDLAAAARRIVWGKFTNTGQTCIAPDHLMATPRTLTALVPHLRRETLALYGRDPRRSADYGRMVSEKQFDRVLGLIDDDKAVLGGTATADRSARYLPPTILDRVDWDDPVMGEEIFGPVLPLLAVDGPDEAIARIRAGEKPLTAYVFTPRREIEERFAEETSSGSLALGLTLAHVGTPAMPFGGVGESGTGAYHGRASLETFTHAKPVVRKPLHPDTLRLVMPPYRPWKKALLGRLFR
ncbi:aldehyde dehydrogenase family protein [Brachybacterium aquaticum]|uniref:Aldehyde dehydrogenase n=1 Tax=Brachybacterium aquaticum TaxID=1432564 RepID=A0A841AGK9_9MICO|nr:aldehyde dehydrogenase family protein [Brachybacterium aquaticum]MBB5832731.1 aldehyde dehydrogenase (NAD+) [Brachybacterium aquaticum]